MKNHGFTRTQIGAKFNGTVLKAWADSAELSGLLHQVVAICIKIDELCVEIDGLCIEMMNFVL